MSKPKRQSTELAPLVLVEDEPVPGHWVDELDIESFARIVAGAAVGTQGPFTIGVFADWGLGKTSLLRQAKSLIEGDPDHADVTTVWFNAWQFEKEDHPIVPLVASIVRAVERKRTELQSSAGKAKQRLLDSLASTSRALRAVAYGFSAKAKWKVPGFAELEAGFIAKEMVQRYEALKPQDDPLLDRSLYYNAFEALEKVAGGEDRPEGEAAPKIVVFVDDLDRCLPDKGLRLLESVKLVLAQRGFVFVLAVDRRILEAYLDKRYRDEFGMADYPAGVSYLDKIVQLPLHLPSHQGRFERYVKELLNRPSIAHDEEVQKTLLDLVSVLALGANANPRSLVRFINSLLVARRLYLRGQAAPDADFLRVCAVSHVLREHLGEPNYRALLEDNRFCDELAQGRGEPIRWRFKDEKGDESFRAQRRRDILRALERRGFLVDLLDDEDSGQHWLTSHQTRREVEQFLIVEAAEQKAKRVPPEQVEMIDAAIRGSLGLSPDAPITEQHRRQVSELSVAGLTDLGLVHVSGLTGLQRLYLFHPHVTELGPLSTLTRLQTLYLKDSGVRDLAPLSTLTNLQSLDLTDTLVTDLGPLSGLTGLRTLTLWNTSVIDLGPLSGLTGLRELDLNSTHVSDLSPLSGLTGLQTLSLMGTPVRDLAPLSRLTGLRRLELYRTQISNLGPLSDLTGLRELTLGHTDVGDIGPLSGLTGLRKLDLDGTKVSDLGPLSGLTGLQTLDLRNTKVSDLGPLSGLTGLQTLDLRNTKVSDLRPLSGLTGLQALYLIESQVSDLGPLSGLTGLRTQLTPVHSPPHLRIVRRPHPHTGR